MGSQTHDGGKPNVGAGTYRPPVGPKGPAGTPKPPMTNSGNSGTQRKG